MWFKQAGLGLLLIVLYWVIKRLGQNWIEALAKNKRVALKRKQSVLKCFNITLFLLFTIQKNSRFMIVNCLSFTISFIEFKLVTQYTGRHHQTEDKNE